MRGKWVNVLNPTTHFPINVSWEWTYDGYHKGHKTKINQNMCGIMYYAMLYSMSGRQKVLGFYSYLYTVTLAHMWLLNNLSSFVKNVIIVKHNTSAIGKTCPSVVLYCFLKYLRECQFFKEIVIFQKSDPFFVLFQTARTLLILTLHWKAILFWKCLYPYFNFKWLFDVATEVKILLWHTFCYLSAKAFPVGKKDIVHFFLQIFSKTPGLKFFIRLIFKYETHNSTINTETCQSRKNPIVNIIFDC